MTLTHSHTHRHTHAANNGPVMANTISHECFSHACSGLTFPIVGGGATVSDLNDVMLHSKRAEHSFFLLEK